MRLIDGLSDEHIAFLFGEVELGHKGLMAVTIEGERVGSLIWSVSHETARTVMELEEMGAQCRAGYDLAEAALEMMEAFAPMFRATHLKFKTRRAALCRKMQDRFRVSFTLERALGE